MGKVQVIQKSRKEYRCSRCGQVIPAGSKYFKGEINFGPTIIRCTKCGLESWEVTTSDYVLRVGEIVNRWQDDYEVGEDTATDISAALQEIEDDLQERLDNMPEGLQEGDAGQLLQERIDALEDAISELDEFDIETIKSEVYDEYSSGINDDDCEIDMVLGDDYDELEDWYTNKHSDKEQAAEELEELHDLLDDHITDFIESALSNLEY